MWPRESAPRELAALLAPYGVRPIKLRLGSRTGQGYRREDLARAWEKLAGPNPATGDISPVPDVPDVLDVPDTDKRLRPSGTGWAEH